MKQKLFLFSISLIISFSACSDDDNGNLRKSDLPETARAFIDSRLPGYSILSIEKVDDNDNELNEKYVVTFSDDLLVSFSSMGYWRRIDSESELPELVQEVIPYGGAAEVKAQYPLLTINKIRFVSYGYMAIMSDGDTRIAFYNLNNDGTFGLDLSFVPITWPENVREFLETYYIDEFMIRMDFSFIRESEADGSGYRFLLYNGRKVYFDKNGDWYYINDYRWNIKSDIYEMLPETSRNIIEKEYGGWYSATLVSVLIKGEDTYQVLLSNEYQNTKRWLLFDARTGEEVQAPIDAVHDFLSEYVGEPSGEMILAGEFISNQKAIAYKFEGTIAGVQVLEMYTDKDGHMLYLSLGNSDIPVKTLDYMSAKVREYVEENYAGEAIKRISNGWQDQYLILLDNGTILTFDKEGNFTHSNKYK